MAAPAERQRDERVAQVMLALEATPLAKMHVAPVVLMPSGETPIGILGLHLGPGHFTLSADDTRALAMALLVEPSSPERRALSAGLEAAANLVDLMQARAEIRVLRSALDEARARL